LNGVNDGLAYALEAQDFENFQVMVNNALVLENHRGVMERKRKLVHQHQLGSSSRPMLLYLLLDLCSVLLSHSIVQGRNQLYKDSLPPQCQVIKCPNNLQTHTARN
jgi:hypothetical protein